MIVTCESCEASFNLDDSRIPPDGIKVRCSRCKHVFKVDKRSSADLLSEFDSFESFHRDQIGKEGMPPEETATGDAERLAPIPDERGDISFEEFMVKQEAPPDSVEPEVSHEGPIPRESGQPEEPSAEEAGSEGIDFRSLLAPEPSQRAEAPSDEAIIERGQVLVGEPESSTEESISGKPGTFELPSGEEMDAEARDLHTSLASELSEVTRADPGELPTPQREPQMSVEAFFKGDVEQESEGEARGAILPSLEEKKFEDLLKGEGLEERPVRRRSSLRGILFLILLLLLGAAILVWWRSQGTSVDLPINIGPTFQTAVEKISGLWEDVFGFRESSLELSGLQGYEDEIGQHRIYVIKGNVTNKSRRAKRYVKLKVIILDQVGNRIREKVIFCGNVFSREELERLSPKFFAGDEILQPKRPKDMVVEARETIPFMAIFSGLSREGKSFKVEKLEAPGV